LQVQKDLTSGQKAICKALSLRGQTNNNQESIFHLIQKSVHNWSLISWTCTQFQFKVGKRQILNSKTQAREKKKGKKTHFIRSICLSDSDSMKSSLSPAAYWLDLDVLWWESGSLINSLCIPLILAWVVVFDPFPASTVLLIVRTY